MTPAKITILDMAGIESAYNEVNRPYTGHRVLAMYEDACLVMNDSGGESITSFTDNQAVGYFLKWLHDERRRERERFAKWQREREAEQRRKASQTMQDADG